MLCLVVPSCNTTEQKTETEAVTTDTSVATAPAAPASTIVNSPQLMLLVTHKVRDYNKWKASYDEHDSLRLANGMHSYVIGKSVEDSNMLLVAVKADDLPRAKAFMKDASLKNAMQKGGVTGNPTISLGNMVWQDTSTLSGLRSMVTLNVTDWRTWQKMFEEGRNERLQNGIADRVYGHDVDNQNKVILVTALTDSAKAVAYWNSDMLKNRRAASGVIGNPQRFTFRIVQRY